MIIVNSAENSTYAETLKKLKDGMANSELGKDIENVGKTRKGDLKITTRSITNKPSLKEEIQKILTEHKIREPKEKRMTLHLRNLDEVTEIEDINSALTNIVSAESIEVKALCPTRRNGQTATIQTTKEIGKTLLELGKI